MRAEVMGMGANGMSALAGDEEIRAICLVRIQQNTGKRILTGRQTCKRPDLELPGLLNYEK